MRAPIDYVLPSTIHLKVCNEILSKGQDMHDKIDRYIDTESVCCNPPGSVLMLLEMVARTSETILEKGDLR